MTSYQKRDLFGGAITANTPSNVIDAADLRQVPDTQEVFLFPDSNISIIVEILEKVDASHFEDAVKQVHASYCHAPKLILVLRFHFASLAHDNSAQSATIESVAVIPNDRGDATPSAIVLVGVQNVPKFNHSTPDEVLILLALYRLEQKNVDLVVTFNIPTASSDGGAVSREGAEVARSQFDALVRSLHIVDFGLFV
ncbi:hypothetical protein DXG03_007284 [Asterophora parasitica]|uniref:Ran guanine nucleotide release factor n=1 Tax=Asterophora parasitica TaxID=117018 RepID=A0A9P7GD45_9AGAR|nr:hypothetical protein DXG03_007284 [Asterophora parasitica]